jgi:hypothetical protein
MTKQSIRAPLLPWQIEAADNARRLRKAHKTKTKMTNETFAEEFDLGSPGNLGHYLHGRQPINLGAAIKLAKGLGCSLAEIHQNFAMELESGGILRAQTDYPSTPSADQKLDDADYTNVQVQLPSSAVLRTCEIIDALRPNEQTEVLFHLRMQIAKRRINEQNRLSLDLSDDASSDHVDH